MSERKVLNKYYPPDFDPSKIPKLKLPKDRQYVVRLMAPFNMRCKTCGEYIYKGKKFNARKETVQNEDYMGLPIFRFYIKCTRCLAEITFKTDPENTDYAMEHGATRNFQAEKLLEEEEKKIVRDREEEELNNPMKVLENRTRDSKMEMEVLENLQELKELNQRQATVDFESMLGQYRDLEQLQRQREVDEDERETKEMLDKALVKRLRDSDSDSDSDQDEEMARSTVKRLAPEKATDILTVEKSTDIQGPAGTVKRAQPESWERSVGGLGTKAALGSLVVRRKTPASVSKPSNSSTPSGPSTQQTGGQSGPSTQQTGRHTGPSTPQTGGQTGWQSGPSTQQTGRYTGPNTQQTGRQSGPSTLQTGGQTGRQSGSSTQQTGRQSGPSTQQTGGQTGRHTGPSTRQTGRHTGPNTRQTGRYTGPNTQQTGRYTGPNTQQTGRQSGPSTRQTSGCS